MFYVTDEAESVKAAVRDAYGVFYVTNYWELFAKDQSSAYDREVEQGKTVADACKAAGVQHVVFSGLESPLEIIGKPCEQMDSKRAVEKYLDEIDVPNTSMRYPFYFENFIGFLPREEQDDAYDGSYTYVLPMDGPLIGMAVADGAYILCCLFSRILSSISVRKWAYVETAKLLLSTRLSYHV